MKIDLSRVNYDGEWVDFGDIRLKIRPMPASRVNIIVKDGGLVLSGGEGKEMFDYCLIDQDGIIGADDQPLKMTRAVKQMIYDFKTDPDVSPVVDGVSLVDFVLQYVRGRAERVAAELKNSRPGPSGTSQKPSMIATPADLPSEISDSIPATE